MSSNNYTIYTSYLTKLTDRLKELTDDNIQNSVNAKRAELTTAMENTLTGYNKYLHNQRGTCNILYEKYKVFNPDQCYHQPPFMFKHNSKLSNDDPCYSPKKHIFDVSCSHCNATIGSSIVENPIDHHWPTFIHFDDNMLNLIYPINKLKIIRHHKYDFEAQLVV